MFGIDKFFQFIFIFTFFICYVKYICPRWVCWSEEIPLRCRNNHLQPQWFKTMRISFMLCVCHGLVAGLSLLIMVPQAPRPINAPSRLAFSQSVGHTKGNVLTYTLIIITSTRK